MSNAPQPMSPRPVPGKGQPKDYTVHMQSLWEKHHEEARQRAQHPLKPHEFAVAIGTSIQANPGIKPAILELGSGMGSDAMYFASLGAHVTSVDFSDIALKHNTTRNTYPNLTFEKVDFSQPLPYAAETYDFVYAHLSLHYYNEEVTDSIFAEVARVLKPGGMFFYACESISDPEYGQGQEVEPGVFTHKDGHMRHFFSVPYTQAETSKRFDVLRIDEGQGLYRGEASAFIYCTARKKAI
jgi:SAM-dependent methyltransferase